jgi:hypothetical protein
MLEYLKHNLDSTANVFFFCGVPLLLIGVFYLIYELLFAGLKLTPIDFVSVGIGLIVTGLALNSKSV